MKISSRPNNFNMGYKSQVTFDKAYAVNAFKRIQSQIKKSKILSLTIMYKCYILLLSNSMFLRHTQN